MPLVAGRLVSVNSTQALLVTGKVGI